MCAHLDDKPGGGNGTHFGRSCQIHALSATFLLIICRLRKLRSAQMAPRNFWTTCGEGYIYSHFSTIEMVRIMLVCRQWKCWLKETTFRPFMLREVNYNFNPDDHPSRIDDCTFILRKAPPSKNEFILHAHHREECKQAQTKVFHNCKVQTCKLIQKWISLLHLATMLSPLSENWHRQANRLLKIYTYSHSDSLVFLTDSHTCRLTGIPPKSKFPSASRLPHQSEKIPFECIGV